MAKLTIADNEEHLADLAAERLTRLIEATIDSRGNALLCLTGGSTPHLLYTRLSDPACPWRDRIDWLRVHLFWSDERHVPPQHPDSNYGMAKAALIDHVPIPPAHVHRIRSELPDAREAAADYEHSLDSIASARRRKNLFDLMLLGVGEDAHIASIFAGSTLLERPAQLDTRRRVAAVWVPHLEAWRITLTPEAILDASAIVVLVTGAGKAAAVRAAFHEPSDVKRYPVQLLEAAGDRVDWFVDRAAATDL